MASTCHLLIGKCVHQCSFLFSLGLADLVFTLHLKNIMKLKKCVVDLRHYFLSWLNVLLFESHYFPL